MKSTVLLFAAAISVSGLALAQTAPKGGVTEITDPAKIAEIERHAQELAASQSAAPMMDEHERMRAHATRHHKQKPMHRRPMREKAMKDKAPADTPMAPDSKG